MLRKLFATTLCTYSVLVSVFASDLSDIRDMNDIQSSNRVTWEMLKGINTSYIEQIVLDPTTHKVIYAATRGAGGLFKSVDEGNTWQQTSLTNKVTGNNRDTQTVAVDPNNPSVLYAGTSYA